MSLQDVAKELQSILADLQHLSLWPPFEAVVTVVRVVNRAIQVASDPPDPEPEMVAAMAETWKAASGTWQEAQNDLQTTINKTGLDVWEGVSADAYRASIAATIGRFDTVVTATTRVQKALYEVESSLISARSRHRSAQCALLAAATIPPLNINLEIAAAELAAKVATIIQSIQDLIGAYQDAAVAVDACISVTAAALGEVELPHHVAEGMSAIDQTNLVETDPANQSPDDGPLRGSVGERAQNALAGMSSEERMDVDNMLVNAEGERKAWILAAVASGLRGDALTDCADKLETMTDAQVDQLDPGKTPGKYAQPDGTTCGSSSLVMSRMINDPAYAMYMTTGHDPRGELPDSTGSPSDRFNAESLAMHDKTNSTWPKEMGTFPLDVDSQMSAGSGGSGVPGSDYSTEVVDPKSSDKTYTDMLDAAAKGHTVPMYSYGIEQQGASGAHVTLVVGSTGDNLTVYNPGDGTYATMTRAQFNAGDVSGAASWKTPLSVSLPK